MGLSSTIIYTSELILCSTIYVGPNGPRLDLAGGDRRSRPEVAILGADQKERGLWGRDVSGDQRRVAAGYRRGAEHTIQNGGSEWPRTKH